MKIAIIQFPGSNCERETALAIQRVGMEPVSFLWNEPLQKLDECKGYIIVGGFSYEDRIRAGVIASLDPVMEALKIESEKGKPILGICNGAQILVESGLIPGLEKNQLGLALTDNKRIHNGKIVGTGYYNAWVHMRLSNHYQRNAFTRTLKPDQILHVPIAHAEGRFIIPPVLLKEMQNNGQNVFQYCDEKGLTINEFPINPNGSIDNIAAVSNKAGNIMAMMPHPERTPNGDAIFQSMREYIKENHFIPVAPLYYHPHPSIKEKKKFKEENKKSYPLLVQSIITDNQTLSLENALEKLGQSAKIKRSILWEVFCHTEETFEKIKASGVLFNDQKEKLVDFSELKKSNQTQYIVRSKEDMIGQAKCQMLKDHFDVIGLEDIRYNILWQIDASKDVLNYLTHSHILYNPYAHDFYTY